MSRFGLTLVLSAALLFSGGCMTHTMDLMPGRLASRLVVDNGVSELDGRVVYLNPARSGKNEPMEVPFAGAEVDVLGSDGKPLAQFAPVRTDGQGRFHFSGLSIGQPYFVRARLTDAAGKPRQLYAFVLPESRFTCVELSLESTIVAQKIAANPDQMNNVKPEAVKELIQTVRKTLSETLGPNQPGGPTTAPPPGTTPGPQVPPPPAGQGADPNAPKRSIWIPGANGGRGYWWCPGSGGPGGAWWIETACGGVWWAPKLGDAGGSLWVVGASGAGSWQAVAGTHVTVPGGSCSFDVPRPPAEDCGCVCVPVQGGGNVVYWFKPNAGMTGGSWWITTITNGGGTWQDATSGGMDAWTTQPIGGTGTGGVTVVDGNTYTWITLPDGSGTYWSPTGGPSGSWWIPSSGSGGGGYWWTSSGSDAGAPPPPSGNCGCHYVKLPGSSVGYWFLPNGTGTGGSFYVTDLYNNGGGSWWTPPTSGGSGTRPFVAPPTSGGSGGAWTTVPGGGTDYIWIVLPGGGGYWWARPTGGGGNGSWWIPTGGSGGGGYWWVSTGGGGSYPPPGPNGGPCGCHWVQPPGSSVGYWFIPAPDGQAGGSVYITNIYIGGGSWVSTTSPTIATGGSVMPSPSPMPGMGDLPSSPSPSPGTRSTVVCWITLPGGGGTWWYPWPDGGGGSYWSPTCSCWQTAGGNGFGYYWIELPGGGGGTWIWPDPAGHGCCCWVPDGHGGGSWVWVYYEPGTTTPPPPPTYIVNIIDLGGMIDGLTAPTWNPGTSTTAPIFDTMMAQMPLLKTQLDQAIDTILNVNVLMPFEGVNMAPFPRKNDPRYLLIGTVDLRCTMPDMPVNGGVAYALNGQEICRASSPTESWQAEYDTRQMKDGEYFLTAHEFGPNGQGLGKMLAKGYARIRNTSTDDPCNEELGPSTSTP
jgi:hypothetical protein